MHTDRQLILRWAEQGHIQPENLDAALLHCQAYPSQPQWLLFIKRLLLWLGVVSIAAGVIFFFAFNWQAINTFTKFATLQSFLAVVALYSTRLAALSRLSTAITFLMALLTGALLALSGQIYQTGADPWQLFAIWAILITPWALTSRSSTLWLLWMGLINTALLLYSQTFRGLFGFLYRDEELVALFLLINTACLIGFEWAYHHKNNLLENRVAAQTTLLVAGFLATWLAIWSVFDYSDAAWGGFSYVVWMGAVFTFYRYRHLDLLALSGCATSIVVVFSCVMIRTIGDAFGGTAMLFVSLCIIGLSTTAGIWLKKLSQMNTTAHHENHSLTDTQEDD